MWGRGLFCEVCIWSLWVATPARAVWGAIASHWVTQRNQTESHYATQFLATAKGAISARTALWWPRSEFKRVVLSNQMTHSGRTEVMLLSRAFRAPLVVYEPG